MQPRAYVAVVGPGEASQEEAYAAAQVGRALAQNNVIVITGGLGGVMAAAARGAREVGGMTVALLPGEDRAVAHKDSVIVLPTGLGELRNGLLVRAADALVAVGGAHGTLSEIALALKGGKAVVGLESWEIEGVIRAASPQQAVDLVLARLPKAPPLADLD